MAAQVYWQSEELLADCITTSTCTTPELPPELPSCYGAVKGFSLHDLINSPVGGEELMTHCREQWGETVRLSPRSSDGKLGRSQSDKVVWGLLVSSTHSHVDGKLGKVSKYGSIQLLWQISASPNIPNEFEMTLFTLLYMLKYSV